MRKGETKPGAKIPGKLALVQIRAFLGEIEPQEAIKSLVGRLVNAGKIPKPSKGAPYDFALTVRAIIANWKEKAEAVSDSRAAHQERQAKADADRAEIALAKELGSFCFRADQVAMFENGIVKMRQAIQAAKKIPEELKPSIIEILQGITLDDQEQ